MKSFLVAVFLIATLQGCIYYPENRKWTGELVTYDDSWSVRFRCSVDVEIAQTEYLVSLEDLNTFCGSNSMYWSPGTFRRSGSELWRGAEQVGHAFSDGSASLRLFHPAEKFGFPHDSDRVEVSWSRSGEELNFTLKEFRAGRVQTSTGYLRQTR